MKIQPKNNDVIWKHNDLINAKYKLKPIEIKLVLIAISFIQQEDEEFTEYSIPISNFQSLIENRNHTRLKEACRSILTKPLELPDESNSWTFCNWFSHIRYNSKKSLIECSFDKRLKPYLLQLKNNYKTYQLRYILNFKSEYSFRIYELLKQYELIGSRYLELSKLQEILFVPESLLRYDNFKKRVLTQSLLDISSFSDLSFEYKEIKEGRKVVGIHFFIQKNLQNINKYSYSGEDYLTWIAKIRKNYVNKDLIFYEQKNCMVSVSEKGYLYLKNGESISPTKAKIFWEWAYNNQEHLLKCS